MLFSVQDHAIAPMNVLERLRRNIRAQHLSDEHEAVRRLMNSSGITAEDRTRISERAEELITGIRTDSFPGIMEVFLVEYGLSTEEGIALMCLAEALLRVPDPETIDHLIEDKIVPSQWGQHLGHSSSPLVNASTWALMLTGKVLAEEPGGSVAAITRATVRRLGEPLIRKAVQRAIQELGSHFVLGETIEAAIGRSQDDAAQGYTYSYDMLGEAALTRSDAGDYFQAYRNTIAALSKTVQSDDVRANPGISVKLSALHPRFEASQKERVRTELVERVRSLALLAKESAMGFNIDAEESERLDLTLDVIEGVFPDPGLAGWDGFGAVVQAYSKRAPYVLDWLYELSGSLGRKMMVRLVKGAYWDTEIKRSQVEGLKDYPVYRYKSFTDISYICCVKKLISMRDRIYPQFATHNAHTASAVLHIAGEDSSFEFQRLHGMGEALHRLVLQRNGTRCRVYAPVGSHRDLLAYLVRRLLENGANSSFVHQVVDESVPPAALAADPFVKAQRLSGSAAAPVPLPGSLYLPDRENSRGWDLSDELDLARIRERRDGFRSARWQAAPVMVKGFAGADPIEVSSPTDARDIVGTVIPASVRDVRESVRCARPWSDGVEARSGVLNRAADLYEAHFAELFAVLSREAGKTPGDAVSELREAVDFLRYYAARKEGLAGTRARGRVACISPWNFPLAIFTGQIAAALMAGNAVLAKPAESASITASVAVRLLHEAGVPGEVLQCLPGLGPVVGAELVSDGRIDAVCFTGSTRTAREINRSMARNLPPEAPLIAETGGLNAMIVDSTALPEQAVRDIVASAFQSAGQRCSALRVLYLQEDVAPGMLEMLFGAMDELVIGDPWRFSTDVGPVIDRKALSGIAQYMERAERENRVLKKLQVPPDGIYAAPAVIEVGGIEDLGEEVFGPVLHVARFRSEEIDAIIGKINRSGYGLTFGLHTRIDRRVEQAVSQLSVGNIYVNRNQIGAIVGSQPFGGQGLSGTGPKAGGPHYVRRFRRELETRTYDVVPGRSVGRYELQEALRAVDAPPAGAVNTLDLPGPTGESNRLSVLPRGTVLCLGPTVAAAMEQADIARRRGCGVLVACPDAAGPDTLDGFVERELLGRVDGFDAVALWSPEDDMRAVRRALADRDGPLVPLAGENDLAGWCLLERHVCVDTTASGGNASLLARITE